MTFRSSCECVNIKRPHCDTYLDCRQFLLVHVASPCMPSSECRHDTPHWKCSWCFVWFAMFLGHRRSARTKKSKKSWIRCPKEGTMVTYRCQFSLWFLKISVILYIRLNFRIFGNSFQFRRLSDGCCLCFWNVPVKKKINILIHLRVL